MLTFYEMNQIFTIKEPSRFLTNERRIKTGNFFYCFIKNIRYILYLQIKITSNLKSFPNSKNLLTYFIEESAISS